MLTSSDTLSMPDDYSEDCLVGGAAYLLRNVLGNAPTTTR
jgi:hypothetical protein